MKFKKIVCVTFFALITSCLLAEKIAVGVAWDKKSGMSERVTKGLEETLSKIAPNIELEIVKETGVGQPFADTVKRFEGEKKAMVLLRSDAVKFLVKNPPSIPTFIGACNHPGQLGAIQNMNAPEGNITGVTYTLPVETQFETFAAILPKMKSVMLLLDKNHAGAVIDQQQTKDICKKYKLEYREALCEKKEDVIKAVQDNADSVSTFIIGSQSLVMDNTAEITKIAPTTPFLSYSTKPVKEGALCGFAADDVKLGVFLAESLADNLIKGKAIKAIPVKTDNKPKLYINADTAEKLQIKIPFKILKAAEIVKK